MFKKKSIMGIMNDIEEELRKDGNEGCVRLSVRALMYITMAIFVYGLLMGHMHDLYITLFLLGTIAVLYILKSILK